MISSPPSASPSEFGVKPTLDHCTDGELIADELAKEGLPVFVGPTLGSKTKVELRNKSFTTPGAVPRRTDRQHHHRRPGDPAAVSAHGAGLAATAGLPMEEAWRAITINPARSLGIDSRVGSLEPGKDADLVLWTADPLTTIGGEAYAPSWTARWSITRSKPKSPIFYRKPSR